MCVSVLCSHRCITLHRAPLRRPTASKFPMGHFDGAEVNCKHPQLPVTGIKDVCMAVCVCVSDQDDIALCLV